MMVPECLTKTGESEKDMDNKLYLSETNRKIAGVCGGIGEYFGIDPTLLRLAWVIMMFVFGTGLLAYIIAWIVIPRRPF